MVMDRISQIALVIFGFILIVLLVMGLAITLQPIQAEGEPTPTATFELALNLPTTLVPATPEAVLDGSGEGEGVRGDAGIDAAEQETSTDAAQTAPDAVADSGGIGGIPLSGGAAQHTVAQGEWLHQIARCYGTSYAAVLRANWIPNPDAITPGQVLTVPEVGSQGTAGGPPCVVLYTVAAGDTWESLAQRHGTSPPVLQRANPGPLTVGTQIWIPRMP